MPDFSAYHLQFTLIAETEIRLQQFKGSALRGAWQSHLQSLYCAQAATTPDPLHQSLCPVCYLLNRDTGTGDDRRPYAFLPPLDEDTRYEPGKQFTFGISVFGDAAQFIPYLILSVGQMGQHQGLGQFLPPNPGQSTRYRGKFRLVSLQAHNPFTHHCEHLLNEGETQVRPPQHPITTDDVTQFSQERVTEIQESGYVEIRFLTPTRIINAKKLTHHPQFQPFFARLLSRILALQQQYAGQDRLSQSKYNHLLDQATQVNLIEDQTRWWDLEGYSSRLGRAQKLGGFIGHARYQAHADVWATLMPWLAWGTLTQVGKHTVRGLGWFHLLTTKASKQNTRTNE